MGSIRKHNMTVKPHPAFVIEDDASLADTCKRALKSVGFEVETFFDGRTAYDRLAVEPAPTGHAPAKSERELWFNLQDSSIIIIAADPGMAAIYQNKEGVDNVLIKPVPLNVLKDLVRPYLSPVR